VEFHSVGYNEGRLDRVPLSSASLGAVGVRKCIILSGLKQLNRVKIASRKVLWCLMTSNTILGVRFYVVSVVFSTILVSL